MAKTLARLGISVKTAGGYHVKFTPEHIAPCLVAEKLRFLFQNQLFLSKARNSWVPNKVTQVQIS